MGQVLRRLLEVFYTKKLDIVVIGLENRWDMRRETHHRITLICMLSIQHMRLLHCDSNKLLSFTKPQRENNPPLRSRTWCSCRNRAHHRAQREGIPKRKSEHEMLGYRRTSPIPIRMVPLCQRMRCSPLRRRCGCAPKNGNRQERIAQITGWWKHRFHAVIGSREQNWYTAPCWRNGVDREVAVELCYGDPMDGFAN